MSEKRGETGKLICDFPTEAVLEVCIKGTWYRVTSKDFRSFDGKRRITKPINQPGQGIKDFFDVEFETYDYIGPVFMFGSNSEIVPSGKGEIVRSEIFETEAQASQSRGR